jgi:hypothetical protein
MSTIKRVRNRFLVFFVFVFACIRGMFGQEIRTPGASTSAQTVTNTGTQQAPSSQPFNLQGLSAKSASAPAAAGAVTSLEEIAPVLDGDDGCDGCDACDSCDSCVTDC